MFLINLMVNLLYRKYGVPLHNFFENWTRGISYLKRKKTAKITPTRKFPRLQFIVHICSL